MIFNENTIKITVAWEIWDQLFRHTINKYCVQQKKILAANAERVKTDCPMQSKCLAPQVVYEAEVTNIADQELKIYYGLTETIFKERHQNHRETTEIA